jgi:hypothetical protein
MAKHKTEKEFWLNKSIDNSFLTGFDSENKKHLPSYLRYKSLVYLNSNKYQVDNLFNQLVYYSKTNNQFYDIFQFNKNKGSYIPSDNSLFNENMLKDFTTFCFNQRK